MEIIILAAAAGIFLILAVCTLYRRPALFRRLPATLFSAAETARLREQIAAEPDKRILVAFFSYSDRTRLMAQAISRETGGDLFEILPRTPYENVYRESRREIFRREWPELAHLPPSLQPYQVVFIGYPVWWHAAPALVSSFLKSGDFSGKLLIPFCTSSHSGIEETLPSLLDACGPVAVCGEKRLEGSAQISPWLASLGLGLEKN